ncbi:NADH dehydrogenase [ubiquinone] 1 beta subcomplex subunit 6, partial [Meleagris gallopavo]
AVPQVFNAYQTSGFIFMRVLIPAWLLHYYLKYHVSKKPYGIVVSNPAIFPGDRILETGEVVPPLADEPSEHH